MKILLVDDQRSARVILSRMLSGLEQVELAEASSLAEARAAVENGDYQLVLVDIRLSDSPMDRGGLDLLRWMRKNGHGVPVVMVTALTELAEIREAMRLGAQDYVLKDELSPEMLLPIVDGFRHQVALEGEVRELRSRLDREWGLRAIIGTSSKMDRVRRLVQRVADADVPVLIHGETGTGKELVARAIHTCSKRREQPFFGVNCSALPGALIESLVFGHERGAFTGADRRVRGQLELAGTGTILLDEIAEMPLELQAKLLRVLEDRSFRPLGAEQEVPLRARVLAASHVDLPERIRDGRFREDLFYRLNVVAIELPSLAERLEDIPELLASFLAELPRKLQLKDDAVQWLVQRHWSGNVRELRNAVDRLALLAEDSSVDAAAVEEIVGEGSRLETDEIEKMARMILALPARLGSKLDVIERAVLHHAVETCSGNKSAAARMVGVDRKAFERRWVRHLESGGS